MHIFLLAASVFVLSTMLGCASQSQPYPISSTEGSTLVQAGYVTDVRDMTVGGGQSSVLGSVLGSVAGAIVGSNIGAGNGRSLATVGGAVAGGIVGQRIGKPADTSFTRLTVRSDSGEVHVHDAEPGATFRIGDRVKIITNNSRTRITH